MVEVLVKGGRSARLARGNAARMPSLAVEAQRLDQAGDVAAVALQDDGVFRSLHGGQALAVRDDVENAEAAGGDATHQPVDAFHRAVLLDKTARYQRLLRAEGL